MADTTRPPRQERLLIKVIMPKQGTRAQSARRRNAAEAIPAG